MAGFMTATDLTNEILGQLGAKATDFPAAQTDRWLNWTLVQITDPGVYRHREMQELNTQTTVVNQGTYSMAGPSSATTRAMYSAVIVNPSVPAQRYRLWDMRERDRQEVTGIYPAQLPRWYSWIEGGVNIDIIPAPGQNFAPWNLLIWRTIYPVLFNSATLPNATSQLQPSWDEVLVAGAVWRGWRHREAADKAEYAKAQFVGITNEIKSRLQVEAEDTDWGPQIRFVDETMIW